jgi:hypothetical protein
VRLPLKPPPPHLGIDLTADEQALFDGIRTENGREGPFSDDYGSHVAELLHRLEARGAIPAIRLRYFTDAELNPGIRRSRQQVFIDNGCDTREKLLTSGNFFRHLDYIVRGPRVPTRLIARFKEHAATALSEFENLRRDVRAEVRALPQAPPGVYLEDDIYMLALESGLDLGEARIIRTDVMSVMAKSRRSR